MATILLNPQNTELHTAIGNAVDAYAKVEHSQATILEALLKLSPGESAIIFYSIQNVRTRHETIQSLLAIRCGSKYKHFWKKVSKFLLTLSKFRNAIVHWTPAVAVYIDDKKQFVGSEMELIHPTNAKFADIDKNKISDFIKDCRYIEQEVFALRRDINGETPARASPNRFLQPNIRRNLAVLLQPPMPKERQRQPQSSSRSGAHLPKPSAKQRRLRALAKAKRK